jgi:hypothetical protein
MLNASFRDNHHSPDCVNLNGRETPNPRSKGKAPTKERLFAILPRENKSNELS